MKRPIEQARLGYLNGIRELNTLLKNQLNHFDETVFYWNTDPYIKSAISENRCFVIKKDSMIMGAMIMESRDPEKGYPHKSLAIGTLSVRPEFRKNGIGIQLVEYAKTIARKENIRLYVESFLEFRQLSFYKRLGFSEAPRKSYHGNPYHVLFLNPPSNDLIIEMPEVL